MKVKVALFLLVVLPFLSTSGCIYRMYEGLELGRGQKAILKIGESCPAGWHIMSINGVEPENIFGSGRGMYMGTTSAFSQFSICELSPGHKNILMHTPWNSNSGWEVVSFYAKPGHTYEIGATRSESSFSFIVIDLKGEEDSRPYK